MGCLLFFPNSEICIKALKLKSIWEFREKGLFIAESPKVIERALDVGYEPVSCLVEKKHVDGQAKDTIVRCDGIPIYTAPFGSLLRDK